MSIQQLGVGELPVGAATLARGFMLSVSGCGSSSLGSDGAGGQSDAGNGAVGIDGGGEPAVGGADSVGGADGVPTTDCPLDALARARTEAIAMQAVNEAGWIVNQTHGVGQFASRGFGFAVPLTTVASIVAITLVEECAGPKMFDEYCPPPEEGGAEASPCSQLECLGAGELGTTLHFEPVPFTAALEPPPGDVSILHASQAALFTDQEDESIAIEWTTEVQLVPEGETQLTITHSATATAGGVEVVPAIGAIAIDGIVAGSGPVQIDYSATADERTGAGTFEGHEVLTLMHDGVVWSAACTAP